MKIVLVSSFYSEGMGYTENCLPKVLAARGHQVDVLTSEYNVYGNSAAYEQTYARFLGPAKQRAGQFRSCGYTVHRLPSRMLSGYVYMPGLSGKVRELRPDVVHSIEMASLPTFVLAAMKLVPAVCCRDTKFRLFTETHQHMSVVKPFLRRSGGHVVRKLGYRITRTFPTYLSSLAVERCYAIAPDCVEVARRYYGVPQSKLQLRPLGTDTELFRPACTPAEYERRCDLRRRLGYSDEDLVCVYTGRLSADKNPLILAKAVDMLRAHRPSFKALFIGEGSQADEISHCSNTKLLPFMKYSELADVYRMADIAVWPRQESMSMLDAAATGLPIVVSDEIGDSDRIAGSGIAYREGDPESMARALGTLADAGRRECLGAAGRARMVRCFNWSAIAASLERDYTLTGSVRGQAVANTAS